MWGRTYAQLGPDLCEQALADREIGVMADVEPAVGRAQFQAWIENLVQGSGELLQRLYTAGLLAREVVFHAHVGGAEAYFLVEADGVGALAVGGELDHAAAAGAGLVYGPVDH